MERVEVWPFGYWIVCLEHVNLTGSRIIGKAQVIVEYRVFVKIKNH